MGRQTRQSSRTTKQQLQMKFEMCNVGGRDVEEGRQKHVCPPGDGPMMPRSKRTALGDVTNNELSPPLVDDFLYLCDDAYSHDDLLKMERDILKQLNYDVNIPVAYRFLRRLARAADASMETHTLARYISESTLQDYSFVTERPSYIAAGAMYLALRIKKLGPWTPILEHYSGFSVAELLPLVQRLNSLLLSPLGETATVRSKYSHEVFFSVAALPALEDVQEDAAAAVLV